MFQPSGTCAGMSSRLTSCVAFSIKSVLKCHCSPSAMLSSSCKDYGVELYGGPEVDLNNIKEWLKKFEGGNVIFKRDDTVGIAEIIFDHPTKKNAISGPMMVQLADIVENLENWDKGKGILIRGGGSMFCSGGDLDFAKATSGAENGFKMACFMHNVLTRLKALPMVSVALIHGQGAIGGGAEVATACDWRLMTSDCQGMGLVHTRMGIVPAWGGSSRLAAIVGSRKALELISSGRIVASDEALQIGLIDSIVDAGPDKNGISEAFAWLLKHTHAEPDVVRASKATLTQYDHLLRCSRVLEDERRIFAPLWGGPANQKALRSKVKHVK